MYELVHFHIASDMRCGQDARRYMDPYSLFLTGFVFHV